MSVDYDLVIIGNTSEAIYAANQASNLKMRVALVEQPSKANLDRIETISGRTYTHFTNLFTQVNQLDPTLNINPNWQAFYKWTKEANTILTELYSLPLIAARGVDIISGSGEFCRLPHLAFIVGQRRLRSRTYLLATGSVLVPPKIIGLDEINYLTVSEVWRKQILDLPEKLTIIGETPSAIQLAQNLRRFGKQIMLLVENERLLPQEDNEISWLLQAQLEAEGIKVFTDTIVTHVKAIDGQKWLQFGNQAIETDEIIIAGESQPNLEGFNLEGVGVKVNPNGVFVNEKLQTTHPRIYACGSVLAGYTSTNIAQQEVNVILKNIKFFPKYKINYTLIPYSLFTFPSIARVGLTERQTKQNLKEVKMIKLPYKVNQLTHILGETTGFIKLIINQQGFILGCHIIGVQAEEIVSVIALAIKQKIKIQSLAELPLPSLTISEIIYQVTLEYQNQSLQKKKHLLNWLETWLIWRRKLVKK